MAPEAEPQVDTTTSTTNTTNTDSSAGDTPAQEQQNSQQQAPTDDKSDKGEQQQASTVAKDAKLPDDHPVVKQLKADKDKLTRANAELAELRAKSAQVTKLEDELKARPTKEALETLQTRYDRLEGFLQAVGGPLGKALDSRSFTKALFETEEDISDLVKQWHKDNPTATTTALSSAAAAPAGTPVDVNKLLRAAAGK